MPFCKIKTDIFSNTKIRRVSDGSFRIWVYLLTQAWEESPNKRAGSITLRGVMGPPEGEDEGGLKLRERYGRMLYSAAGCSENEGWGGLAYAGFVNELENVRLVEITEELTGTTVPTCPGDKPGTTWDITIQMHDWDYHNPRVPPSHTPDGEAERKRKYRERKKIAAGVSQGNVPTCPNGTVPSVPTLDTDQDQDKDLDQDFPSPTPSVVSRLGTEGRFEQGPLSRELQRRIEAGLGHSLIPLRNGKAAALEAMLERDGGTDAAYHFVAATCRNQPDAKPKSMSWVATVLERRP